MYRCCMFGAQPSVVLEIQGKKNTNIEFMLLTVLLKENKALR